MSGDLLSYTWMAVCSRTGSRADCRTGRCCSLLSVCSRRGAGGSREGEFGKILSGAWRWKRGWDPLPSAVIPMFGMLAPTVSFGRDMVMRRGAEAGRLLGSCLCEEDSGKAHVGILGLPGSGSCWKLSKGQRGWAGVRRVPCLDHTSLQWLLWGFWKVKAWEEEGGGCWGFPQGRLLIFSWSAWRGRAILLWLRRHHATSQGALWLLSLCKILRKGQVERKKNPNLNSRFDLKGKKK